MNTRPMGDDSPHTGPTGREMGHGHRRCLDQHREVAMQVRRSGTRSHREHGHQQQTVLMRGAVVASIIAVLSVGIAVINNSGSGSAGASAPPTTSQQLNLDVAAAPTQSSPVTVALPQPDPTPAPIDGPSDEGDVGGESDATGSATDDGGADGGVDESGGDAGILIDPGGLDPADHDNVDEAGSVEIPPPDQSPAGCDYQHPDADGDGIPTRWDFNPCIADRVSAAAPCESFAGVPVQDPYGDWDGDGVPNESDVDPCDSTVNGAAGDESVCEVSESGTGDGDSDGIPDRWDYDPCVPSHVSAAAPCDSYNGNPNDDPAGDWDADDAPNAIDPAPCDPMIL